MLVEIDASLEMGVRNGKTSARAQGLEAGRAWCQVELEPVRGFSWCPDTLERDVAAMQPSGSKL